jgi:septal ring factor EnvC (AmiA/AmiB activator)
MNLINRVKMNQTKTLRELLEMQSRASLLAEQIHAQFNKGLPPGRIVPLLKEQAQNIALLQASLKEYVPDGADREDIEKLKSEFGSLVERTEQNYKAVSKKGLRLTGIGGKPYTPHNARTI